MKTIKARVHRLPTELMSGTDGLCDDKGMLSWRKPIYATYNSVFHHLYFTTDEEPKDGEWIIETSNDNLLTQFNEQSLNQRSMGCRKIIATTDPKLFVKIKEYKDLEGTLPQIPQSFIEEYCKAGGIDEVLVECDYPIKEWDKNDVPGLDNKVWITKLEPKLNPDNTIIIHPVEEKMYTLKQIKHMFDIGRDSAFQEMHFDEAIKYRDNELNKMD